MKKLIIVALLFSLLIVAGCSNEPVPDQLSEDSFSVVRVVDGDTIIVDINGTEERVRLIGIDTPESVHPDPERNVEYGKIASDFTKEQLEGKSVTLEYDVQERDQYGRILAYVYLDSKMFNKTLLEEGHAMVVTYPPNVKYVDDFMTLQEQSRESKNGVWAYGVQEEFLPEETPAGSAVQPEEFYVANSNTMKFHRPSCRYVDDIAEHNVVSLENRDDAISMGYTGCKACNP